jgi:hypothetical protein
MVGRMLHDPDLILSEWDKLRAANTHLHDPEAARRLSVP